MVAAQIILRFIPPRPPPRRRATDPPPSSDYEIPSILLFSLSASCVIFAIYYFSRSHGCTRTWFSFIAVQRRPHLAQSGKVCLSSPIIMIEIIRCVRSSFWRLVYVRLRKTSRVSVIEESGLN